MLKARVLTAAIVLPALIWLLVDGPQWGVAAMLIGAIVLSVVEMSMMIQPRLDELMRTIHGRRDFVAKSVGHYRVLAFFCAAVMSIVFLFSVYNALPAGRGIVVFGLIFTMLAGVFATRGIEAEMARVLGFTLTLVYAGFPWLVVWDLYANEPHGRQLILTLAIVWLGDTGGFFGGRLWGKHKLAPVKSPKKTWEGAIAGLSASMAGALACHFLFYSHIKGGVTVTLICGFLGGIAGQLGDLVESVIKRFTGVKDSGTLLPGHGGVLDRIDGLLFAAPMIWFILYVTQVAGS